MGRAVLLIGAIGWSIGALFATVVALVGAERLLAALPPLAIDADAVRGAAVAVGMALGAVAVVHLAVLAALRGGRRVGWSAAVLLGALAGTAFVVLAAAAFTSAIREPALLGPLLAGGSIAVAVAVAYGVAAASFVREIRAGRPVGRGR